MAKFDVCLECFFTELPYEERIKKIAGLGFDCVEFWHPEGTWDGSTVDENMAKDPEVLRQVCQETGVSVGGFVLNAWDGSYGGCPVNSDDHGKFIDQTHKMIDFAKKINCSSAVIMSGTLVDGLTRAQMRDNMDKGFAKALEIAENTDPSVTIVGEDFTQGMLVQGQAKLRNSKYGERILLVNAPCEEIPHPDNSFDAITIAFGIRNVVDRPAGLREMFRVLKPGGRAVILEFSTPRSELFRKVYYFYFQKLLPAIGGLISKRSAYQYLPDSVMEFPDRQTFKTMMEEAGFADVRIHDLTGGIAAVHVGIRKAN